MLLVGTGVCVFPNILYSPLFVCRVSVFVADADDDVIAVVVAAGDAGVVVVVVV